MVYANVAESELPKMDEIKELKKKIFLTAYKAGAAHLASSFSVIDLLYVLYCKQIIRFDPQNPWSKSRDRLILSKGHAGLALYVILNKVGLISDQMLEKYCQPNSCLGGEPKLGAAPGIEASTGSLGHGLSFAVGIALACKMNHYDNKVYVILGDGECQEGSIWEGALSAPTLQLDNLTVIVDHNKLQAMDALENIVRMKPFADKWKDFGWNVLEIDGHCIKEIRDALLERKKDVPTVIIANTVKGKGVSFMEGNPIWHYRMPNETELPILMRDLNLTQEELES